MATENDGRFKPGQSGNPNGRPPGARNKRTLALDELLETEGEDILKKAIEKAKEGDTTCIRLCLDRTLPARRDRHVAFDVPEMRTVQDATAFAGKVVNMVAAGELTPSEAADLGKLIDNYVRAIETSDIERRLSELEQKNAPQSGRKV